jgi:hypothetical protein
MNDVYQFIRTAKRQILSSMFSDGFAQGFFIFLGLIILLLMPFLVTQDYLDTSRAMIAVYLLLVIGVLWKFIIYMREKPS